jgi:DNA helicase HerA-like ATPase
MATKLSELAPRSGERAVVIGQTGCGKTWFVRSMLGAYRGRRQIVIIDSKHDPALNRLKGARYCATLSAVERSRFPRWPIVVWRPQGVDANDYETFDRFYAWLYARGNTVAYIDEVAQTVQGPTSYGPGFNDLVCRGRVRGLVVIYGTQRPVLLPRIIFSESSRFFVFYIVDKRDRQTIAAFSDPQLETIVPDRHGFWYMNVKTREVSYFSGLDL